MHVTVFKTDRYSRAKVIIEVKAEQFQFMFKSIFNTRPEMLKFVALSFFRASPTTLRET